MYLHILLTVVLILCVVYVYHYVRSRRAREVALQYPPCLPHIELPIFGSFYHFITNPEDIIETFLRVGRGAMKAGGIGRMYCGFKYFLVLTDLNDMKEALSSYLEKEYLYTYAQIIFGKGSAFVLDASISKVRRRLIVQAMSPKRLANFIPLMWTEAEWLTDNLAQYVGKGPVSVEKYLGGFCCNNILSVLGVQEMKEHKISSVQLVTDLSRCYGLIYDRATSVWMLCGYLYKHTNDYKETKKFVASFYEYADKAQEIRRNKLARYKFLPGDNIKDKEEIDGFFDGMINSNILSRKEINEEIMIAIGASDEASIAMAFTLLLLAQYPSVQDTLYEEIQDLFGDSESPLSKDDMMKMTYLDMVIKESMRLYPPVAFVMRRADKEVKLSSGRIIPEGVSVIAATMCMHRNPKHWGSDAEHFDPERFRPERPRVPDNVHTMPFGNGPRMCPAYKIGIYFVKVGITAILRKYKVVGTPAPGPVPNIRVKIDFVLKTVNQVEIQLESRH